MHTYFFLHVNIIKSYYEYIAFTEKLHCVIYFLFLMVNIFGKFILKPVLQKRFFSCIRSSCDTVHFWMTKPSCSIHSDKSKFAKIRKKKYIVFNVAYVQKYVEKKNLICDIFAVFVKKYIIGIFNSCYIPFSFTFAFLLPESFNI